VNTKDNTCRNALHVAAVAGMTEACKILVSAGADPLMEDKRWQKPHELARQEKHWETVDYLMDPYNCIALP